MFCDAKTDVSESSLGFWRSSVTIVATSVILPLATLLTLFCSIRVWKFFCFLVMRTRQCSIEVHMPGKVCCCQLEINLRQTNHVANMVSQPPPVLQSAEFPVHYVCFRNHCPSCQWLLAVHRELFLRTLLVLPLPCNLCVTLSLAHVTVELFVPGPSLVFNCVNKQTKKKTFGTLNYHSLCK